MSEINPNPSMYMIPKNYKGSSGVNVSESVVLNGYPNIAYHTDYFSGWMAQNSTLINLQRERTDLNYDVSVGRNALNYVGQTANNVGAIMGGNIVGGLGGFATSSGNTLLNAYSDRGNYDLDIANQMAQIEKQSMLPNSASLGGSNATLIGYDYINQDLFARYSIKRQFAERIDSYFDMFGYKTNKVKLPNVTGRPNWNYVKTIGLNITGNIPQEDLQTIKSIFDNGVTIWHNPSTFLDYSQNNR